MKRSFPPVVDADTRVLVLGSLPGEIALGKRQYYGHPRNLFWPLMSRVVEVDLVPLGYEERLAALRGAGVGLWDTVGSARREGSLDSALRDVEPNDVPALVATLSALRAVGLNGGTSTKLGTKLLSGAGVPLVPLPSSSPAYASRSFDQKLADWMKLRAYL